MMHLTIGVIARDGERFIGCCLASVSRAVAEHPGVQIVLADCASRDGTTSAMLAFARSRSDTTVLRIEGSANASVARNAILDRSALGGVFLIDGDVEMDLSFISAAMRELEAGTCDAVFGQLLEFSNDRRSASRAVDRYRVRRRAFVRILHGVVMLGPEVVQERWRYDETQRRSEDIEFGLRLAKRFRILALPIPMGTHHGISYFASERVGQFAREAYLRPIGRLISRSFFDLPSLVVLLRGVSGQLVGLGLIGVLGVGVGARSGVVVAIALAAISVDAIRFTVQGRLRTYIPHRIIGGLQILYGMLIPEYDTPKYVVRRIHAPKGSLDRACSQGSDDAHTPRL